MHFMIIILYPHNFWIFCSDIRIALCFWMFLGFFFFALISCSFFFFIFIGVEEFEWNSLLFVSNFIYLFFFILGMCIRKKACLFVSLHFCPQNEILISLLRVYCLVEHLVKEMDDLNDACVLDIVYFVEGKCSFLTILFVVSYKTNTNNNLRKLILLKKCVDYFQLNLIIQTA